MNFFSPKEAAKRYAHGRPYFHPTTLQRAFGKLNLKQKPNKALDIACGTGLSAQALLPFANEVYATDLSAEMLNNAVSKNQINYSICKAEEQPFTDNSFDLITVSSGIHWFNIDDFLKEANRLLKPDNWLLIYDNFFISEMEETPSFNTWYTHRFLPKFPAPPRNNTYIWDSALLKNLKFSSYDEEKFKNGVYFNLTELILYLTTQSNITQKVETEQQTYSEIENWLHKELSAFYNNPLQKKQIYFGNWIKYLKK